MKNHPLKNEKGSIAILTAVLLVVLLGFGALCTDMAVLYVEKAKLQNAVDAAALAGAQELPDSPQDAYLTAAEYAANNNVSLPSISISNHNREIEVSASEEHSMFLAKVLGITKGKVGARSKAGVYPVRSIAGAAPLSVTIQDFVYGQEYTLKNAPPEGQTGWYGPVRLDGSGASTYEDALSYGNNTPLSVGQTLQIETGNMSGPTRKGLDTRLASDTRVPGNTFTDHDSNAPEIVFIPIVQVLTRSGESIQEVKILGFAAFFIENVTHNGNDCFITGRFLKTCSTLGKETSSIIDDGNNPVQDYGLYSIKLLMN
ncbi:hypothetical protein UNSWDHB_188 [Dehalobacter sp. UNSWDHB]|jgi:hypothetical protein|uniref:pilus assembly protein TadG-related protein n=1 Tax=unclassified Dehalobacter TaxID=2635733 RepID=UPI00028A50E9|nr:MULTISPECIES: pilus assembly protein TadG-related protein [unclassified Dehalobacter]AFV01333.1 hypothetical protein DHBDCA_p305 [Dehalobacter sp. DCA]AFV04373.1 hypothetical protein DCF50_p367 [Dehalobacter sp. CF]EQB22469.1 hypothetical protein UNSWDHB_188 [Dehalobacter sp. UNSWDHB]